MKNGQYFYHKGSFFQGKKEDFLNDVELWFKDDRYHREDGPAVIHPNGRAIWYRDEIIYRDSGPAIIEADGSEYWCLSHGDITTKVKTWIADNQYPHWSEWDREMIILFKLTFG